MLVLIMDLSNTTGVRIGTNLLFFGVILTRIINYSDSITGERLSSGITLISKSQYQDRSFSTVPN
jgi:hypothetical protein